MLSPSPLPVPIFSPPARANRSKIRSRSADRHARAAVLDVDVDERRSRRRGRRSDPPVQSAFSKRFVSARSSCARSTRTAGSAPGQRHRIQQVGTGRAHGPGRTSAWLRWVTARSRRVRRPAAPRVSRSSRARRNRASSAAISVDCCSARRGEVGRVLQQAEAGGQRGHRRAQLVADVGREPGVLLDPLAQCVHHVVERADERGQVGVVGVLEVGASGPPPTP